MRMLVPMVVLAACSGPPAPDGAVCRDVIHRLCLPPRCAAVTLTLGVNDTCESVLLSRTGCASEDFIFPDPPSRDRILECRLALLRAGAHPDDHPSCSDVSELVDLCPDVMQFFGATGGP